MRPFAWYWNDVPDPAVARWIYRVSVTVAFLCFASVGVLFFVLLGLGLSD